MTELGKRVVTASLAVPLFLLIAFFLPPDYFFCCVVVGVCFVCGSSVSFITKKKSIVECGYMFSLCV